MRCLLCFLLFSTVVVPLSDVRYRAFSTDHRSKPAAGFVDGDLLERFVDLPRDKMESVAMETKVCTMLVLLQNSSAQLMIILVCSGVNK